MLSTLTGNVLYDSVANANLPVKRAKVDAAASADLVAAVTGKSIRVVCLLLVAAGAVTAKLQSGGSTDLTGAMTMAAGVPLQPGFNPGGHVQTTAGEKLNLVLGGAGQVSGWVDYVEV